MFAAEEPVEGVVVRGGVARADQRPSQVRPAPHAVAHVRPDRIEIEGESMLHQLPGHPLPTRPPSLLAQGELGVEFLVFLIHEKGQDMDIVLPAPLRRDLGAGDQLDPPPPGFLARLRQALERVVVGQRESRQARVGHATDQGGRRVEAVARRSNGCGGRSSCSECSVSPTGPRGPTPGAGLASSGAMDRKRVARVLDEMAVMLELAGANKFKVRAYENAAHALLGFSGDLEAAVRSGELKKVPGIGATIFGNVESLVLSGRLPVYEELRATFLPGYASACGFPVSVPGSSRR